MSSVNIKLFLYCINIIVHFSALFPHVLGFKQSDGKSAQFLKSISSAEQPCFPSRVENQEEMVILLLHKDWNEEKSFDAQLSHIGEMTKY